MFQKGDNSSFHASGSVMVRGRTPGCDMPPSKPRACSRVHRPFSERQSKHSSHIKAAEAGHSTPVYWFVIPLHRLITVGLQRASCPSAKNLKVEVLIPVRPKENVNRPINQYTAKLPNP